MMKSVGNKWFNIYLQQEIRWIGQEIRIRSNIISFTLHIVLILRYLPLRIKAFTSKCVWGYKVSNSLQGRWPTFGNTLSWIRCIRDTHDICIASMTGPSYVNVDICLEITRDLHDTLILNFTFICIFKEFFF